MMMRGIMKMSLAFTKFIWFGIMAARGYTCLQMTALECPASVMRGEPVTLNCTFDLEGDILYSIKWYKNSVEFYRYIPSERPPGQNYTLRGIYLDDMFIHGRSMRLEYTDLNSEGNYRCEVSAESPSFQTVMDEKELRIYVLPEKGPTILGARPTYRIGDEVNVTCMSGPSKPPSFLQWDVNGNEVQLELVNRLSPLRHTDGLLSSMLSLRFMVEPVHFTQSGSMRLRCTAYISKAYQTTRSEIAATNKAKIADQHAATSREGPTITGWRLRYQEGNVVNVNCTATRAHPPAELRWYINDKEASRDYLRQYDPERCPEGKCATVLGLRFTVRSRHFQRGEMRLKCTATLFRVTDVASEEMVIATGGRRSSSGLHVYISKGTGNSSSSPLDIHLLHWTVLFALLASSCR